MKTELGRCCESRRPDYWWLQGKIFSRPPGAPLDVRRQCEADSLIVLHKLKWQPIFQSDKAYYFTSIIWLREHLKI